MTSIVSLSVAKVSYATEAEISIVLSQKKSCSVAIGNNINKFNISPIYIFLLLYFTSILSGTILLWNLYPCTNIIISFYCFHCCDVYACHLIHILIEEYLTGEKRQLQNGGTFYNTF